jgi:hypothetical protein
MLTNGELDRRKKLSQSHFGRFQRPVSRFSRGPPMQTATRCTTTSSTTARTFKGMSTSRLRPASVVSEQSRLSPLMCTLCISTVHTIIVFSGSSESFVVFQHKRHVHGALFLTIPHSLTLPFPTHAHAHTRARTYMGTNTCIGTRTHPPL